MTKDDAPLRYTVIVGVNEGPGDRPVLSYADDDAARLFLLLSQESEKAWLLSTFDPPSARTYPDLSSIARAPTTSELARVLGEAYWLIRQEKDRGRPTELVFAFAGHGDVSPAGDGYLVFADGAFSRRDLARQVVEASPADVNHLILDACSSYFMVNARGGKDAAAKPLLSPALLDVVKSDARGRDASAWSRTGVLVSTSDGAAVHESSALRAGVFSYLLRSALAGAADIDADGRVEYAEAAGFIRSASQDIGDERARLDVHVRAPRQHPHAALSDLDAAQQRLLAVDVRRSTHLRILDANGSPYAELHVDAARTHKHPLYVRLVGAPHFIIQDGTKEASLVPRSPGAYALTSLRFTERSTARGDELGPFAKLFSQPFGSQFLSGLLATSDLTPPSQGAVFSPAWAIDGAPTFQVPWSGLSYGSLGVAGVLGLAAGGAAVGNLVAFSQLQAGFADSRTIDPDLAFEVEAWRTTSTVLGAAGLSAAVLSAGFFAVAQLEGEP